MAEATTEVLMGPGTHHVSDTFSIKENMFDGDLHEERGNPSSNVKAEYN